jgi:hypothetical protein
MVLKIYMIFLLSGSQEENELPKKMFNQQILMDMSEIIRYKWLKKMIKFI